jgi:hypothetical protein
LDLLKNERRPGKNFVQWHLTTLASGAVFWIFRLPIASERFGLRPIGGAERFVQKGELDTIPLIIRPRMRPHLLKRATSFYALMMADIADQKAHDHGDQAASEFSYIHREKLQLAGYVGFSANSR